GFCHSGCSCRTTRSTASLDGISQVVRRDTIFEQERHDGDPLRADVAEVSAAGRELREDFHLPRLGDVQQTLTDHVSDEQNATAIGLDPVDAANVLFGQLRALLRLQVECEEMSAWPWRTLAASWCRRTRCWRWADRAEDQPRPVHEQTVRLLHDVCAFDEHRRLPVLRRIDLRAV